MGSVRVSSRIRGRQGLQVSGLFGLGVLELVVIASVATLVFGPKKLPEIGRSIGKTVKSFRQAFSNVNNNSELANTAGFSTENEQLPPSKHHMQGISHQPEFQPLHQTENLSLHQNQHVQNTHPCAHSSILPNIHHPHQSPAMSEHMTCLQSLSRGHVLTVMSSNLAKFCDERVSPYL